MSFLAAPVAITLTDDEGYTLGTATNPLRIDPTGVTPQPVTGGTAGGGGASTIADGADVAEGTTTDAAVVSDVSGTVSGKLRGLVKIFADVWDSVNHRLNVAVQNFPSGFNVNNFPASQAVTGTFFQATQAVSLATLPALTAGSAVIGHVINDASAAVIGHVIVDSAPTTAVTGTFFQATQPVSGTVSVSNFPATQTVAVNNFPATQPISGTVTANDVPPTLTKGTQGATGFSTQDLKDAGRTPIVLSATGIVSVTTEAMMTFQKWVNGTVTAGITSYTVTAGKTFRIQLIRYGARFTTMSTTVTFANTTFNLRSGSAISSAKITANNMACAANAATSDDAVPYPDGLELPAGTVIGVSHLASGATLTEEFSIVGYEY